MCFQNCCLCLPWHLPLLPTHLPTTGIRCRVAVIRIVTSFLQNEEKRLPKPRLDGGYGMGAQFRMILQNSHQMAAFTSVRRLPKE